MTNGTFLYSVLFAVLVSACVGSPVAVGKLTPEQITSVSDKNLCFAFDRGQSSIPTVRNEVGRRRLNCSRVLLAEGIEPTGAALLGVQNIAPQGNCDGIEFMGVYVTEAVVGLRGQFAKVRNRANYTKIVEVSYFDSGKQYVARSEVGPGAIESIRLAVSDHPVTNARLVSCS